MGVVATASADLDHADETLSACVAGESDADLFQGLTALAELLTGASETLNQCLLTLENKLNAAAVAREEWVPIVSAGSGVERPPTFEECPLSQERVFGGVAVTILKMPTTKPQLPVPATRRCAWQYQLGYAVAGGEWRLMIRIASSDASGGDPECSAFSDLMALREAPLEIRLKAIREIPALMRVLAERMACEAPVESPTDDEAAGDGEAAEQLALELEQAS